MSGCFCVCCWGFTLWRNNVLFITIIILLLLSRPCAKEASSCPPEPLESEDTLFMLYTSGTTGKPKGIVHTQAGCLYASLTHQARQSLSPFSILHPSTLPFSSPLHSFSLTSLPTISSHLPLFFLTTLTIICHLPPSPSHFITSFFSVSSSNLSLLSFSDFSLPLLPLSVHFLPLSDPSLLYPCSPLLCGAQST